MCTFSGVQTDSDGENAKKKAGRNYAWIQGFEDGKTAFDSAQVVNFDLNSIWYAMKISQISGQNIHNCFSPTSTMHA